MKKNDKDNWLDGLSIDDLPERYQEMARIVGIEKTIELAHHFGKCGFYFTSMESFLARKKEEYIRKNFNGSNHKDLARATGYSERWVYEILRNGKDERQSELFQS